MKQNRPPIWWHQSSNQVMQSSLKTTKLHFVAHSIILTVAFLHIQSRDFRAESLQVSKVVFFSFFFLDWFILRFLYSAGIKIKKKKPHEQRQKNAQMLRFFVCFVLSQGIYLVSTLSTQKRQRTSSVYMLWKEMPYFTHLVWDLRPVVSPPFNFSAPLAMCGWQ